jgi:16S rRNA (cytosine1402-N4)-methyltransferase
MVNNQDILQDTTDVHSSVMLDEAINYLNIKPNGIYIDGTFGRGGHTKRILEQLNPAGKLLVCDLDIEAI